MPIPRSQLPSQRIDMSSNEREPRLRLDRAIKHADQDRLNIRKFVEALARPILEAPSDGSFVLGLYGPWGRGKSSALNLLADELTRGARENVDSQTYGEDSGQTKAKVIRFTPWYYTGVESLLTAFFETLGTAIGEDEELSKTARTKWERSFKALGRMVAPTAKLIAGVALPKVAAEVAEKGADAVAAIFDGGAELMAGGEIEFSRRREEAASSLAELGNTGQPVRVVVLIDELDRVGADEILAILKMVKLVADLPNVTYVLAIDIERVGTILDKRAPEIGGAKYLEKIIQLGIELPPSAPTELVDQVLQRARRFATEAGLDPSSLANEEERWEIFRENRLSLLLEPLLSTLRDTSRLTNTFAFVLTAAGPSPGLFAADLLLLCAIQTFAPQVFRSIPKHRAFLLGIDLRFSRILRNGSDSEEMEKIFRARTDRLTDIAGSPEVLAILEHLFPHAKKGDRTGDVLSERKDRHAGRIRAPNRFDGYFRLVSSPQEVPRLEVTRTFSALLGKDSQAWEDVASELNGMQAERREGLVDLLRDHVAVARIQDLQSLAMALPSIVGVDGGSLEAIALQLAVDVFDQLMSWRSREEPPNSALALKCMTDVVNAASPDAAADFAYTLMRLEATQQQLAEDGSPQALAAAGLARSVEWLDSQSDPFGDYSPWDAAHKVWACQQLAVMTKQAGERVVYPWLRNSLRLYIDREPHRVCEVIALGLSWSVSDEPRPIAVGPTVPPGRLLEAAEMWVGGTEAMTAIGALTGDGSVSPYRWPEVVQAFQREILLQYAPQTNASLAQLATDPVKGDGDGDAGQSHNGLLPSVK